MFAKIQQYISPIATLTRLKKILREKRCPACLNIHTGKGLCESCLSIIKPKPENICIVCGEELNSPDAHSLPCITCQTVPRNFSRLYFHSLHEGLLRDMLLGWKFNNQYGYSTVFQQFIEQRCADIPETSRPDLIIPVPLHAARLRERGFNQSLVLARFASSATGAKISAKALIRTRKTIPQTKLSGAERRKNLHTAFTADPSLVEGKKILLMDDVYTTGSTVDECARTLLKSRAEKVEVMTLSRALI